ncbi:MAG: hypothetical protein M3548_13160 [Actinomycetota bacterium]|nr:hypothetical protein [Actinomycetota bacterium]
MRKFVRDNGLGLGFDVLFLLALVGQALSGHADVNDRLPSDGGDLVSSKFAVDVAENWQSEFLAIGSMAVLSVFLRQRGSPESKPVRAACTVTDESG